MSPGRISLRWRLVAAAVAVAIGLLALSMAALGRDADVVVYNGRSQYGDEQAFKAFEAQTGLAVELRGGTAPELYERLRREGDATDADLLVTTDLANLWRATEAGLLEPVATDALSRQVAPELHDPDGAWWGISTRLRVPMRSTERVDEGAIESYEDLGDPQFRGRLCLRTSNNEYNQSFVADRIAKHGAAETEELLRSWMANEPQILGSDVDVLKAIAAGRCDVGLTNHYYLERELAEDPDFPVAPVWADQQGRGTHVNLSGFGVVRGSDRSEEARELIRFLREPAQQEVFARNNHEFPAVSGASPPPEIERFGDFKRDPIDVDRAGPLLDDALRLMDEVGWK